MRIIENGQIAFLFLEIELKLTFMNLFVRNIV